MATNVDLENVQTTITSVLNGSLVNRTVDLVNILVATSDGLPHNTGEQDLITEVQSVADGTEPNKEEQWIWLVTLALLMATLLVNGAVLGVTWRATRLHSTLYAIIGSLALAHTLNAFLVMPMAINAAIYGKLIHTELDKERS